MPFKWVNAVVASLVITGLLLLLLDFFFPLSIPKENALFARIVVDEKGRPLRAFADDNGVWRYPVTLNDVSPYYLEALLTYEDRWFWYHPGVNPAALLRAFFQNATNDRIVSGGSTLTMQVARLLHPHDRSYGGKLQQLFRALQLEWHFSKKSILEMYLNIAPYGGTIEGVQAASYLYLNKPVSDVSHAEAALLAVLPQAPTRFRPDLHPSAAEEARNKVLNRMASLNQWSSDVVADAMQESVFGFRSHQEVIAPLLSRRLVKDVFSNDKDNATGNRHRGAIKTTIDGDLQRALEDYVQQYVHRFPDKTSIAILVVENTSAAVKAYLGSADFSNPKRFAHVDMVTAIRSPGSTLKPFLFALSLDEGLIHENSLLADVPRTFSAYRPENFSRQFSGPVSASEALIRSLNIPFVDLLERYGPNRFIGRLQGAGMTPVMKGKPNLSVILGGVGISLEDLVMAYRAFSVGGKVQPLRYYADNPSTNVSKMTVAQTTGIQTTDIQTTDPQTTTARTNSQQSESYFLSEGSAWLTYNTLKKVQSPSVLRTSANTASTQPLAWKTGTSYGFRDAWAIGTSQEYTLGVWVGRPDGTPMPGFVGRDTAGPLLFKVADFLGIKNTPLKKPNSITNHIICWPLGTTAKEQLPKHCHRRFHTHVIDEVIPPTWHQADSDAWQSNPARISINPKTNLRVSPGCKESKEDSELISIALWPKMLDPWLPQRFKRETLIPQADPLCSHFSSASLSTLKITGLTPNGAYRLPKKSNTPLSLTLQAFGGHGRYHWYINGQWRYSAEGNKSILHEVGTPGEYEIVVTDEAGNVDRINVSVL
ncbi:penicillin-binding protein 1C [Marinibactrum halimedae]|uniref:peptidoglycan glycosyltransferase n=1 Tax=Marinibactrum halimedae TaxID=1444977 RepID=A0AA37T7M7_9GAMM|nr:penicillin-binding protein 1C [Marinibactrum halimedae]MCD9458787.1 penicillin-binding protein 1C [Marinibactrum halimedae]GLS25346.1 penicillin-binding protein 1C [Marinibactrum halimedae]